MFLSSSLVLLFVAPFLQVKSEAVVASGVADEDIVNCVQVRCLSSFLR
jgi:hypothetical protein